MRGSPRRLLAKLHRWSGLALLAFLLIAGLTGTWLAFRHELDRWLNPHLRTVQPRQERVTLAEVYDRVEARFPDALVTTTVLQTRLDDALVVYLRSKSGTGRTRLGDDLPFNQVYVDPYTGDILGQRSTTRLAFAKEYIDPIILRLHYSLLLERPGLLLMGAVALVWLLTTVIGVALAWPHAWRRAVAWIPIFSVRSNGGAYKVNYDLHRAVGVALLPVLSVLALTSTYLNLPEIFRPAVNAFSPITERPVRSFRRPEGGPIIGPDLAVARALAAVPDARVSSIRRDFANRWYSVLLHKRGDVSPSGDNFAYIDFDTGDVAASRLTHTATAGDRFIRWQFPLHTGLVFGRPGQIVVAISGLCLVALNLTGFYVWWHKWRPRKRIRAWMAAPVAATPLRQSHLHGTRAVACGQVLEPRDST